MASLPSRIESVDTTIQFLAWLYWISAGFNGVLGLSMAAFAASAALLAGAARTAGPSAEVVAGVTAGAFMIVAIAAMVWGSVHAWCARALHRRESWGRIGALGLALVNLMLFPFGTLLAVYSAWVLMQEDIRARFERS
jgi:hypothetical protein